MNKWGGGSVNIMMSCIITKQRNKTAFSAQHTHSTWALGVSWWHLWFHMFVLGCVLFHVSFVSVYFQFSGVVVIEGLVVANSLEFLTWVHLRGNTFGVSISGCRLSFLVEFIRVFPIRRYRILLIKRLYKCVGCCFSKEEVKRRKYSAAVIPNWIIELQELRRTM